MPITELPGLLITTPLGSMAAMGLLRVLSEDCGLSVGLGWHQSAAFIDGATYETITDALLAHMIDRSIAPEFNFSVSSDPENPLPVMHLREIPPSAFLNAAKAMKSDSRALGFLAAMASDAVVDAKKGFCERTSFDFSSGRQKIVEQWRELAKRLDPQHDSTHDRLVERINSALLNGPFEQQHSFGWEPATVRSHATHTIAPTDDKPVGHPMQLWLGVESLPLHPVRPVGSDRCQTIGFLGNKAYVWPQWKEPLSCQEVRLLRARSVESLQDVIGVVSVYQSRIGSGGKYRFFHAAALTSSYHGNRGGLARYK